MKMSKASDKEWQALVDYFNAMEDRDEAVPQWRRVVFGFRVVVDNACDPDKDTLEFKPEIGEAMDHFAKWKADSSIETWFPISAEEHKLTRQELNLILGSPSLRVSAEVAKARESEITQLRADCAKWITELEKANRDFCDKAAEASRWRESTARARNEIARLNGQTNFE
jgi:hypothetical protein